MLLDRSTKKLKLNKRGLIPAIVQDSETKKVLTYVYLNREAVKKTRKSGELWLYHRSMKKVWKKGSRSGNTMKVVDMYVHHDRHVLLVDVVPNGPACHTGRDSCFWQSFMDESSKKPTPEQESEIDDNLQALKNLFDHQDMGDDVEVVTSSEKKQEDKDLDPSTTKPNITIDEAEDEDSPSVALFEKLFRTIQGKIMEGEKNSYTAKMAALGGEKIAQKLGENVSQLTISIMQNDPNQIVKKEAEMIHHLLILLAEKGTDIHELEDELGRRIA